MLNSISETLNWIILGLPIFIIVGTVHEYMHAWTARRLGDYTATMEGRLTLNPIKHLDPWGLLLMVVVGFGWMKPVPVNAYNFKNPVRDMGIVAIAGPLSNLFMALAGALLYHGLGSIGAPELVDSMLQIFVYINLILMLFNLIPIPPLDGSRVLRVFLPDQLRYSWDELEKYSFFLILALFLFPPLSTLTSSLLIGSTRSLMDILL